MDRLWNTVSPLSRCMYKCLTTPLPSHYLPPNPTIPFSAACDIPRAPTLHRTCLSRAHVGQLAYSTPHTPIPCPRLMPHLSHVAHAYPVHTSVDLPTLHHTRLSHACISQLPITCRTCLSPCLCSMPCLPCVTYAYLHLAPTLPKYNTICCTHHPCT